MNMSDPRERIFEAIDRARGAVPVQEGKPA